MQQAAGQADTSAGGDHAGTTVNPGSFRMQVKSIWSCTWSGSQLSHEILQRRAAHPPLWYSDTAQDCLGHVGYHNMRITKRAPSWANYFSNFSSIDAPPPPLPQLLKIAPACIM